MSYISVGIFETRFEVRIVVHLRNIYKYQYIIHNINVLKKDNLRHFKKAVVWVTKKMV